MVPVIVGWANLHVECVFGVTAVGLFAAGEWFVPRSLSRTDAWRAVLIVVGCVAATLLTPYGVGLWRYTLENSAVPRLLDIAELRPPYLPNYLGYFVWSALTIAACVFRWRRLSLFDRAVILFFGALGWRYLRLTPLLFFVSAPVVSQWIDALDGHAVAAWGFLKRLRIVRSRAFAVTLTVLALLLSRVPIPTLLRDLHTGGNALEPGDLFSPAAMQFARDHQMGGPAFTSINLGGYVAWHLYPEAQVFIDSRLQAYPPEHFLAISQAAGDREAWDRLTTDVDWAVLSVPRKNPFSGTGQFDERFWGTAYRDRAIEILVRRHGRYGGLSSQR